MIKKSCFVILILVSIFVSFSTAWICETNKVPLDNAIKANINLQKAEKTVTSQPKPGSIADYFDPLEDEWSLLNLLCVLAITIFSSSMIMCGFTSGLYKTQQNIDKYIDESGYYHRAMIRFGSIFTALAAISLFLFCEDMSCEMIWWNKHTLAMLLLLIAQMLTVLGQFQEDLKSIDFYTEES